MRRFISLAVCCTISLLLVDFASAENRVVGTVEATIDGREGYWYVIASGSSSDDEKSTSMWMDRGSGFGLAMISGFDSQTVTFRRRADAAGLEPVSGTVLAISFLFSRNDSERTIVFPTEPSDPSTVVFQPEAGNYQDLYALEEGEMVVTKIETVDPGVYRFEGSFTGRFLPLQGTDSVEVTDGSFVIEEARLFVGE
jgi:hypothetical protein